MDTFLKLFTKYYFQDKQCFCIKFSFIIKKSLSLKLNFCLVDLTQMFSIATIQHNSKLDWLELNETGYYIFFCNKKNCYNINKSCYLREN